MSEDNLDEQITRMHAAANGATNAYVTNITNITNINVAKGGKPYIGRRRAKHGKRDRPPKLTRFYSTMGLLDGDIAYGMGDAERMCETGKVMAYTARGIGKEAAGIARGVGGIADAAIGVASSILDLAALFIK